MITSIQQRRLLKQPTKTSLRNIALYYLERYESTENMLRRVLYRRIDKYAFANKDYDPEQAFVWAEEVIDECLKNNFISDERFARIKIKNYLKAGKPKRYIEHKLAQKGIVSDLVVKLFDEVADDISYSEEEAAFNFVKKKKIGAFHPDEEQRHMNRQKDLGSLIRAGFSYDIAVKVLGIDGGSF